MSAIFISHSSNDSALAKDLERRLAQRNHQSVFLDLDPEKGIVGGQSWERTLYRKLRSCRVVIALCTDHYLRSNWCFAELALARMEGKQIVALQADPLDPQARMPSILMQDQLIDLRSPGDEGYTRLWRALKALDFVGVAGEWNSRESPYLGLSAYQEKHAPVFFGREAESLAGIELLQRGAPGLIMVLGASGSGKSSLMLAGMLPRLRSRDTSWLIVDPFRPGRHSLAELTESLAQTYGRYAREHVAASGGLERIRARLRVALTASAASEQTPLVAQEVAPPRDDRLQRLIDLLERLQASPPPHLTEQLRDHLDLTLEDLRRICADPAPEPGSAAHAPGTTPLVDIAHDLRRVAERRDARVLIAVDQFEELLGQALEDEEPRRFLQLLRAAVEAPHSPVMILATMRSDFLGLFQRHPILQGIDFESLSLGSMGIEGMRRVIQMPARLAALDIEDGLVERLLHDTETPDALPLLSFTLSVLYRDRHDDSKLQLAEYEQLGGLQGTVSREADAVLASATREHKEEDLRVALLQMARLSEDGSYARLAVDWDTPEIARAKPILDKLVERRVLVSRVEGETRVVEVAHEALFRTWKPLQAWLDNSRADLLLRQQLERDAATWQAAGRTPDTLWRGGRLLQAKELFRRQARGEAASRDLTAEFVRAGLRRRRLVQVTLGGLTAAVIAVLAFSSWYSRAQARQAQIEKSRALDLARVSVANDWITRDPTQGALVLLEVEDPENTRFAPRLLSQALAQAVISAEFQDVGPIHSVALTGDGSQLLTTARQQSTVWDVRTGQPVRIVQHEKSVLDGAFDPTGRFAVVRQGDVEGDRYFERPPGNEAWVYDVASGQSRLVARHDGPLNSAVFSPNGRLLATASDDRSVRLWDVETGAQKGAVLPHGEKVEQALFSPDGRLLATVSENVTRVWNVDTGSPAGIPPLTGDNPAFSPSGMLVATRVNGGVQVWDLTSRNWKFPILEHTFAKILSFGVDDQSLLTASFQDARVWHGGRDKAVYYSSSPVEHEHLNSARFSAGDSLIVTASGHSSRNAYSNPVIQNIVRFWDVQRGKRRSVKELKQDHEVMSLAFGPEAQFVVSNSAARTGRGRGAVMLEDSTARMWDVATRDKRLMRVIEREGYVSDASFSADGSRLLTVVGNSIRLYDWRTGMQLGADMTHAKEVTSASFAPDDTLIVSASRDGTARTWDATSGRQLFVAKHNNDVGHALLVANRRLLATLSGGALRLWDVSRGSAEVGGALFELAGYSATLSGTIAAESISSDGALVANRTKETVQIWDVKARRQARPPLKHGGYVRSASFVDGGRLLVVGGDDKAAAVWDMRVVGDAPKFALSHTANVDGVEVSPDGRTVLTRSDDGFARLWDATTGRALFPPLEHSCALRFGMFIAGGRAVMTRSRDDVNCPRVAILWNVATGQRYSTMDMTGASAVGFSPSGTLMFSDHRPGGSEFQDDGTVSIMRVWNANSGELRFIEPFTSKDNVIAAAFTPDGTHLMIASGRQVSLWAVSATRLQSTLGASTRLCLKPEFRRQNLGETAPEASERYIACERRRGRK